MTRIESLLGCGLVLALLACLVAWLPAEALDPRSRDFVLLLGVLGMWRYGWAGVHLVRSWIYRNVVFPRWRRAASDTPSERLPPHVFVMVTSFRIDAESSLRVYRAALAEAVACGRRATLVASIVEAADERLVRRIFEMLNPPERVDLRFVRIPGTGKRDGLAMGFSAISRMDPPPGSVVAVVDGDSVLPPGGLMACAEILALRPEMGALTTDEISEVEGIGGADLLYREWYALRFAQRHLLMGSMGLARRVLTLTGRFSMFRAEIATSPEFIRRIRHDSIEHWRLGRIELLTGDDKSSWFHLLSHGYEMGYVPDVQVVTIERPPNARFLPGALQLMVRWFGNMLRTNARARSVPLSRVGFFTWWSLIDQRISMWTSLFGLVAALLAAIFVSPALLLPYVVWVFATRVVQTLLLCSARPRVSPLYPFLIFFNQIVGSAVKVYMVHHLHRQKWTRQGTVRSSASIDWRNALLDRSGALSLATSALGFVLIVATMMGLIETADWQAYWVWLGQSVRIG